SEIVTRMLNERLQGALKQPFVLENRVGATGNVGADAVAKAPPDGHLFGITTDTVFAVNPLVFGNMPFDPWSDLAPVTLLGSFSQMLVCNSRCRQRRSPSCSSLHGARSSRTPPAGPVRRGTSRPSCCSRAPVSPCCTCRTR